MKYLIIFGLLFTSTAPAYSGEFQDSIDEMNRNLSRQNELIEQQNMQAQRARQAAANQEYFNIQDRIILACRDFRKNPRISWQFPTLRSRCIGLGLLEP